jgi:hypothetical protein
VHWWLKKPMTFVDDKPITVEGLSVFRGGGNGNRLLLI